MSTTWIVYIVKCSDQSLYTGITTDLNRRINEHNNGSKGAKYTRNRRPVTVLHTEKYSSRSKAAKREYEIKKYSKEQKQKLIDH